MRSIPATLFAAGLVLGCSGADEDQSTNWSALELEGKTLDLVDGRKVETYSFSAQGLVAATVGSKGGPVAGPLYFWKIKDNVLVISEEPDQQNGIEELADPKVQDAVVSASRKSGDRVRYRLSNTHG